MFTSDILSFSLSPFRTFHRNYTTTNHSLLTTTLCHTDQPNIVLLLLNILIPSHEKRNLVIVPVNIPHSHHHIVLLPLYLFSSRIAEDDRTIIKTKKIENFKICRRIKLNCINYLFIFSFDYYYFKFYFTY
jgi:hypothetical protein